MNKNKTEMNRLIEEIKNKPDRKTISGILRYQNESKKWMVNNQGGFTMYFESSYEFYVNLITLLNYVDKKSWASWKIFTFIYLGNSTYPLFKAYSLTMEGFNNEALVIIRSSLELLVKSLFCAYYPNDHEATFVNPGKKKRAFNFTNFVKDDLKVTSGILYRLPSSSVHGQLYITKIFHALRSGGKHDLIGMSLKHDPQMINVNMNFLTFLIWIHIYLTITLFSELETDKHIDKQIYKDSQDYITALGHIVKSSPGEFSAIGADFEKVISTLQKNTRP